MMQSLISIICFKIFFLSFISRLSYGEGYTDGVICYNHSGPLTLSYEFFRSP